MINKTTNNHFETPDLGLAAFLLINEIPYFGIRWPSPQQAVFIFATPPDNLLASWMKEDGFKYRAFQKAIVTLRKDVIGAKR